MTSKVELANTALAHIRAQSINSFTEASLNAQYVNLFYDQVRDSMFRDHNWNWARSEKPLALLADVDLFDFAYSYQYPSDCLRINYLKSPLNQVNSTTEGFAFRPHYYDDNPYNDLASRRLRIPYAIRNIDGNRVIGANEPDLWVDYRLSVTDPNKYDSTFRLAFPWYLAAHLAMPILGGEVGRAERGVCMQMYVEAIKASMADDMNEEDSGIKGGIEESEFILARN